MDGYITIGTKVDTKGLEKGINEAKKELENFQKEAEKLEEERLQNETILTEEYQKKKQEIRKKTEEKIKEAYEYASKKSSMEGWQGNDIFADNVEGFKEYGKILGQVSEKELKGIRDAEARQLKELDNDYQDIIDKNNEINQKIEQNTQAQSQLNDEISRMNGELTKARRIDSIKDIIKETGKELEKNVRSVKNWIFGIFGVYSAYGAIRNAMNVISSQDEQLKADIDYMKNALAYTLEPVVRKIVELAKQLMTYIGYIIYQWTGYNIFENANKSLKKANGQAKALQKTMAGFDEMNVLNDSSGGRSSATPSFDLTVPTETQGWVTKLPALLAGIAAGIGALKLSDLLYNLGLIPGKLDAIKAIGIGGFIASIIQLLKDLKDMMEDPTFENFTKILYDISFAALFLGISLGSLPIIIAGIIALIWTTFIKNYEKVKEKLKELDEFMYKLQQKIRELFGPIGEIIFSPFINAYWKIRGAFENILDFAKQVCDGVVQMFQGDFKGGMKTIFDGLVDIVKKPLNKIIDNINKVIRSINSISFDLPGIMGGGHVGFNIKQIPRLARGGIVNNPGRGVMMGNYVAGENGAEAVLPLTDDTLQKLANMIPITINLTNTMNGRVISRELKKVQNEQDFAFNR